MGYFHTAQLNDQWYKDRLKDPEVQAEHKRRWAWQQAMEKEAKEFKALHGRFPEVDEYTTPYYK